MNLNNFKKNYKQSYINIYNSAKQGKEESNSCLIY